MAEPTLTQKVWMTVSAVVLMVLREVSMTWLEELAVNIVITVLAKTIKNPKSAGVTVDVLQHIRDDAAEAVLALNPNAPPPPGYVVAP